MKGKKKKIHGGKWYHLIVRKVFFKGDIWEKGKVKWKHVLTSALIPKIHMPFLLLDFLVFISYNIPELRMGWNWYFGFSTIILFLLFFFFFLLLLQYMLLCSIRERGYYCFIFILQIGIVFLAGRYISILALALL